MNRTNRYVGTILNTVDALAFIVKARRLFRKSGFKLALHGRNPNRIQFVDPSLRGKVGKQGYSVFSRVRRETVGTSLSIAQSTYFDIYIYDSNNDYTPPKFSRTHALRLKHLKETFEVARNLPESRSANVVLT